MAVNPKKVFVVHGRNWKIKGHMMAFLRVVGLSPISWGEAIQLTGSGAPYIGQTLDAAFSTAQAVIVLLTGDDEVLLPSTSYGNGEKPIYAYQPRPNVLFELGIALATFADSTILVEFEHIRLCRTLEGRHRIRLSNHISDRMALIHSLQSIGCAVELPSDEIIRNTGDFRIL